MFQGPEHLQIHDVFLLLVYTGMTSYCDKFRQTLCTCKLFNPDIFHCSSPIHYHCVAYDQN